MVIISLNSKPGHCSSFFAPQFVAKYGTKYDYLNNVHAWTANYNDINNVSNVNGRRDTQGEVIIYRAKITLTSVRGALSRQSCSRPGSRGRTSCSADSGITESISRFFVMGTLRNLVLRGESAGHDRNH